MKYFKLLLLTLFAGMFLVACEDANETVTYKGNVIHADTRAPFADLEVSVTDGTHINQIVHTDAAGNFAIVVRFNEINSSYYLLIGDNSCIPVKREFKGFGQAEVDLGTIEVEGPKVPVVTTAAVYGVTSSTAMCGGKVTEDGRSAVSARGVCWSKTEYPTVNVSQHTSNGAGLGEFQSQLTNLEPGTTYYIRAYATNSIGTSYGGQTTFTTTTGLPKVITDPVSNILATSATCGGTVDDNSGYAITARGICWSKLTASPTTNDSYTTEVASTGHFSSLMVNLERNTTYYVRAYASNEKGISYGETVTFTTLSGLPNVTTDSVSNIHSSTAVCNCNVIDNGGYTITARGVCWSTSTSTPSVDGQHTNEVADKGTFSSLLTGLEANTMYYVRAYATNEVGTSYGASISFTTANGLPEVETLDPGDNITSSSITAVGNVLDDGGSPITERGVVYSTLPYPTLENSSKVSGGSGTGYFSATIEGISPTSYTYYIRAYATNDRGTSYGGQVEITPERSEYLSLKTMVYGGYTYKIKFVGSMSWYDGNTACNNMVYGGYDDWFMPNDGEVSSIIEAYEKDECIYYNNYNLSTDRSIEGVSSIWTNIGYSDTQAYYYYISRYNASSDYTNYYCWRYEANNSRYRDSKGDIKGVFAVRKYRTENK